MDYIFFSRNFKDVGISAWHSRSDHRPVPAEVGRQGGHVIRFQAPRSSVMRAWAPTPAAVWRLQHTWASWAPANAADVQSALEGAAAVEAASLRTQKGAAARGVAPLDEVAR